MTEKEAEAQAIISEVDPELIRQRRVTDNSLWARINVWFARRAFLVWTVSMILAALGYLGFQPGTSPSGRFVHLEKKMDMVAETLAVKVARTDSQMDRRLAIIEDDHTVLRTYVRFLVVTRCLELTPQAQRDLEVANISCRKLQDNGTP